MGKKRKKLDRTVAVPDPPPEFDPDIDEHEHGGAAKPVSLHPLDFDTAIRGLLAVKASRS